MKTIKGVFDGNTIRPLEVLPVPVNTVVSISYEIDIVPFSPLKPEDVAGCLKYDGPPVSVADMHAAIEEAIKSQKY